eukprot:5520282-Amphidinium_carterae.1
MTLGKSPERFETHDYRLVGNVKKNETVPKVDEHVTNVFKRAALSMATSLERPSRAWPLNELGEAPCFGFSFDERRKLVKHPFGKRKTHSLQHAKKFRSSFPPKNHTPNANF